MLQMELQKVELLACLFMRPPSALPATLGRQPDRASLVPSPTVTGMDCRRLLANTKPYGMEGCDVQHVPGTPKGPVWRAGHK